jgi:methionyl-tRNA formyltransferase
VLFLGPETSPLVAWLREQGETVVQTTEKVGPDDLERLEAGFIVSFGYRHIIKPDVLDLVDGRAINLHISYLPYNRGADPNLWAFVEGTPKGVTIHYLDEGLDTGDILAQQLADLGGPDETLRSSYEKLQAEMQSLFRDSWADFRAGRAPRVPQVGAGSVHRSADKAALGDLLAAGWDTPVSVLEGARPV